MTLLLGSRMFGDEFLEVSCVEEEQLRSKYGIRWNLKFTFTMAE